ncbi:hypothetical protein DXG01_016597 [Tephrocybe rancida]|nr:hypothetical protein DXG01_016597 [Tephrocybe rancida]
MSPVQEDDKLEPQGDELLSVTEHHNSLLLLDAMFEDADICKARTAPIGKYVNMVLHRAFEAIPQVMHNVMDLIQELRPENEYMFAPLQVLNVVRPKTLQHWVNGGDYVNSPASSFPDPSSRCRAPTDSSLQEHRPIASGVLARMGS